MIRALVEQTFDQHKKYFVLAGNSNDNKPTSGLITGSKFLEVDTGTEYAFDEASNEWVALGLTPEEAKAAIAGEVSDWLDAHPEATTTVEDGAITYAKLSSSLQETVDEVGDLKSAVELYKNLYNKDDLVIGKNWVMGDATDRAIVIFPAKASTGYYIDVPTATKWASVSIVERANNTTPIASLKSTNVSVGTSQTLTTTSSTKYICIQYNGSTTLSASDFTDYELCFQEGSSKDYTAKDRVARDDIEELDGRATVLEHDTTKYETVKLANMVVASDYISAGGVYLSGTGNHVAWNVNPGDKYLVSGTHVSVAYPLYVILGNSAVVSTYSTTETNVVCTDVAVTIPEGADQLVINGYSQNITLKYLKKLDVAYSENMWKYLEATATEGFMLPSGNINTALGSGAHYKQFPVSANDQVMISGRRYSNLSGPAWLLLKNGSVVGYQNSDNMPSSAWSTVDTEYYEDFQMTIPDGVDTLVVNCGRAKGGRCAVRSPRDAEPAIKKLNGKTAVVYGTSIFSNTMNFDGNVFSIPSYAGMLLGMDIINEAVGASIAARGNVSVETADDPYGWTGVSWYAVFRAMGKNLTECQDLIDNYGSKWYDKIAGSTDPLYSGAKPTAPLSQTYIDEIKADSYENKLIPYLDGTKPMPDLFIFEHGHNDYWNDGEYGDLPEDETNLNMSTFMGAMSFYIKKIFEANRNAKILIVSFYDGSESDAKHGAAIVEGQKKLAEYQNVYFCDMTVTGWNQRLVTTTGYWGEMDTEQNGYYWIPSGGTERTITRRQYFIPDDLHPHLDASGRAVKQAGQILADYIKNNINLD